MDHSWGGNDTASRWSISKSSNRNLAVAEAQQAQSTFKDELTVANESGEGNADVPHTTEDPKERAVAPKQSNMTRQENCGRLLL